MIEGAKVEIMNNPPTIIKVFKGSPKIYLIFNPLSNRYTLVKINLLQQPQAHAINPSKGNETSVSTFIY